jgi:antitoxin VapB
MSKMMTAKLFRNGGSQAVRLPAEFKFDGEIVYIRHGDRAGEVVLSSRDEDGALARFLERVSELEEELEFDLGRDALDESLDRRVLFEDEDMGN